MTVATAQAQADLLQAAAVVVQAVHLQAEAVLVAHQCSNAHQSNNTNILIPIQKGDHPRPPFSVLKRKLVENFCG